MAPLPFLGVSHLPSSSSFFASILQPLGIVYVQCRKSENGDPSIIFGTSKCPVLEVRQVDSTKQRRSHLVLSAPSKSAVAEFYARGTRAYPQSVGIGHGTREVTDSHSEAIQASLVDMDGNRIDVIYEEQDHSQPRGIGYAANSCQAATNKVDCDLIQSCETFPRSYPGVEELRGRPPSNGQSSGHIGDTQGFIELLSSSTIVGTLFGIAAGAAIAYGAMGNDEGGRPAQQQSTSVPSPGDTVPSHQGYSSKQTLGSTSHLFQGRQSSGTQHRRLSRHQQSSYDRGCPPNTSFKVLSPKQSVFCGKGSLTTRNDDNGTQLAVQAGILTAHKPKRCDSVRDGGEHSRTSLGGEEEPLGKGNHGVNQTHPSVYFTEASKPCHMGAPILSTSAYDMEQEEYVSATSRQLPPAHESRANCQLGQNIISGRNVTSRAVSRLDYGKRSGQSSFSSVSASRVPLPPSRASSYISADFEPLPQSVVDNWHADHDSDSIFPSDSISCVGPGTGNVPS